LQDTASDSCWRDSGWLTWYWKSAVYCCSNLPVVEVCCNVTKHLPFPVHGVAAVLLLQHSAASIALISHW